MSEDRVLAGCPAVELSGGKMADAAPGPITVENGFALREPKPNDTDAWVPGTWHNCVQVYPVGSLRCGDVPIYDYFTPSQVKAAVSLLENGYCIGFSLSAEEAADMAMFIQRHCAFPLAGVWEEEGSAELYLIRRSETED